MGIFNKKNNDIEEKGLAIAEKFSDDETKKYFLDNWEKYSENGIVQMEKIKFIEETLMLIQQSSKYNFEDSIKISKVLKKIIITSDNDKVQKELYMLCLKFVLMMMVEIDTMINLLGLFVDRSLLLNLLNYIDLYGKSVDDLEEKSEINGAKFRSLVSYMFQARQYYVDESAFLTSSVNLYNNFMQSNRYNFESKIEEQIDKDKQLAGIYDISQEDVAQASDELIRVNGEIEAIYGDIKQISSAIDAFRDRLDNLDALAAEERQKILVAIEDCWKAFLQQKKAMLNEISNAGNKYLDLMKEKFTELPVVVQSPTSVQGNSPIADSALVSTQTAILFDSHLSLEKRLDMIKEKIQGGMYHNCFISAIKQLLINKSLYLTGPGGSGKTQVVYQMAELLGLPLYNLGFIADEFTAFKGYMDANGNFVKTPFYTAFKYGGIVFLDEIDNSDSKALIELNKFVSNEGYKPYLFPNDELVYPHPNFRLVAAGNTWGNGADYAYSTREKLDASTIRRFAQVYCGFDNKLEQQMFDCKDDEMFEFAMCFRETLDVREGDDDFSTGDLCDVNIYLKSGIYSASEILDLKFIRNRRIETLQNIISNMSKQLFDNSYMNLFKEKINEMSHANVKRKNR